MKSITVKVDISREEILGYSHFDSKQATCALISFPNPSNQVMQNRHLFLGEINNKK
jgi:hypothetical protein